ncbi:unnamed protein product [Effrenium voratum]|uniref:Uncharacterized protein n=1 Tax=Effrenium voratum TaxID=2562239 RepID=A0AA36JCH1_9DINO|nr:unnamed protein product [Effrenium voratum]
MAGAVTYQGLVGADDAMLASIPDREAPLPAIRQGAHGVRSEEPGRCSPSDDLVLRSVPRPLPIYWQAYPHSFAMSPPQSCAIRADPLISSGSLAVPTSLDGTAKWRQVSPSPSPITGATWYGTSVVIPHTGCAPRPSVEPHACSPCTTATAPTVWASQPEASRAVHAEPPQVSSHTLGAARAPLPVVNHPPVRATAPSPWQARSLSPLPSRVCYVYPQAPAPAPAFPMVPAGTVPLVPVGPPASPAVSPAPAGPRMLLTAPVVTAPPPPSLMQCQGYCNVRAATSRGGCQCFTCPQCEPFAASPRAQAGIRSTRSLSPLRCLPVRHSRQGSVAETEAPANYAELLAEAKRRLQEKVDAAVSRSLAAGQREQCESRADSAPPWAPSDTKATNGTPCDVRDTQMEASPSSRLEPLTLAAFPSPCGARHESTGLAKLKALLAESKLESPRRRPSDGFSSASRASQQAGSLPDPLPGPGQCGRGSAFHTPMPSSFFTPRQLDARTSDSPRGAVLDNLTEDRVLHSRSWNESRMSVVSWPSEYFEDRRLPSKCESRPSVVSDYPEDVGHRRSQDPLQSRSRNESRPSVVSWPSDSEAFQAPEMQASRSLSRLEAHLAEQGSREEAEPRGAGDVAGGSRAKDAQDFQLKLSEWDGSINPRAADFSSPSVFG